MKQKYCIMSTFQKQYADHAGNYFNLKDLETHSAAGFCKDLITRRYTAAVLSKKLLCPKGRSKNGQRAPFTSAETAEIKGNYKSANNK